MKSRNSHHPTAVRSFSPHRLEGAFQIAAALFTALLLVSMDTAPAAVRPSLSKEGNPAIFIERGAATRHEKLP